MKQHFTCLNQPDTATHLFNTSSAILPTFELFNVNKEFTARGTTHVALSNISLYGMPGETVGLVGESGSGKSTIGKILVGLLKPSKGTVAVSGNTQILFQDPESSLNPRKTILWHIEEAVALYHRKLNATARSLEILDSVQLPRHLASKYPHELSLGQKQRAALARALAPDPTTLVLDEPLASLDVGLRRQILELLRTLQERRKMSYLYITHDLATLARLAHRVYVLKKGEVQETGSAIDVLKQPKHPYTQLLVKSIPSLIPSRRCKEPSM